MIKFVVLSVAVGTILSFVREITHVRKHVKRVIKTRPSVEYDLTQQ
jgi:hypothetical protein